MRSGVKFESRGNAVAALSSRVQRGDVAEHVLRACPEDPGGPDGGRRGRLANPLDRGRVRPRRGCLRDARG